MPINFTCPNCGKSAVVADQFAGQSGPCSNCGAKVTIPNAPISAFPQGPTTRSGTGSAGMGTVLMIIFAVLGVTGLVCAGGAYLLIAPAVGQARKAAQRAQSSNNLKQLGLALHNYHDTYQCFPPAVVKDKDGKPLYSGRVLLLPFMEQNNLYQAFDKDKAWNSPENERISQTIITTFLDPGSTSKPSSRSDYVFVTGKETIFDGKNKVAMNGNQIPDGTSNTLVMVETLAGPSSWAEPKDWDADTGTILPGNRDDVIIVLFADGSVKSMRKQSLQQFMKPLTGRMDGQPIPDGL